MNHWNLREGKFLKPRNPSLASSESENEYKQIFAIMCAYFTRVYSFPSTISPYSSTLFSEKPLKQNDLSKQQHSLFRKHNETSASIHFPLIPFPSFAKLFPRLSPLNVQHLSFPLRGESLCLYTLSCLYLCALFAFLCLSPAHSWLGALSRGTHVAGVHLTLSLLSPRFSPPPFLPCSICCRDAERTVSLFGVLSIDVVQRNA